MPVEALVGHGDQPLVEPALVSAALVAADQQNRLSLRVEGDGNPPDATSPAETRPGILSADRRERLPRGARRAFRPGQYARRSFDCGTATPTST